ncbi:A24 family peptidase [Vibrio paucivorans]
MEIFWWAVLSTISLWVCYTDVVHRKISNRQSVIVFVLCLILMIYSDNYSSYLHSIIILLMGILLFTFGFWGAGDAKLLSAFSLAIKPDLIPVVLSIITFLGLVLILSQYIFDKFDNYNRYFSADYGVPYGIAISIGANFGVVLTILSGK